LWPKKSEEHKAAICAVAERAAQQVSHADSGSFRKIKGFPAKVLALSEDKEIDMSGELSLNT